MPFVSVNSTQQQHYVFTLSQNPIANDNGSYYSTGSLIENIRMPTHPQPESSGDSSLTPTSAIDPPAMNSEVITREARTADAITQKTIARPEWIGRFAVAWGIGGVVALLSFAVIRILSISIDAFGFSLTWIHWTVLAVSVVFLAYTEGYRTFQKIWAPRVIGRAFELKQNWTPVRLLLAPLYSMSFFHATRKRRIVAWVTTLGIVLLVVGMNQIAQPWRGLIDAGVVVGLGWGVASLVLQSISRLRN